MKASGPDGKPASIFYTSILMWDQAFSAFLPGAERTGLPGTVWAECLRFLPEGQYHAFGRPVPRPWKNTIANLTGQTACRLNFDTEAVTEDDLVYAVLGPSFDLATPAPFWGLQGPGPVLVR